MDTSELSFLCCPVCKGELVMINNANHADNTANLHIQCVECQRDYPVVEGVVRFIEEKDITRFSPRMNFFRNIYARIYSPATRLMFLPCGGENNARHEVLDRLEIERGNTILETGIGHGDNLPYLKTRYGNGLYIGLDNQQQMIAACSSNLKKWNIPAILHLANAEELPYRDNFFDVVFHLGAFNLFRRKKQAMEEMIRVAKPGSLIVIADETEKANKLYGLILGKQEPVVLPAELVPDTMLETRLDIIWKGYGYVLSFRKPTSD